jgi:curved DNA-binding protein CbpA
MNTRTPATSKATIIRLLAPPSPCHSYRSFLRARVLRISPLAIDSRTRRSFTTSESKQNPPQNHYQVLGVPPDCTKAELKKHFYTLSKENHPDLNPHNSKAHERFSQISESYSVLSDPEKRRRYDRDHMRPHSHGRTGGPGHRGSYAGSRPASGLSKRRGAFRGPPPSFYAHGNPSANTARQASGSGGQGDGTVDPGGFDASRYTDPGQFDPAFDPSRVFRTQTQEDARRQNRRNAEMAKIQEALEADQGAFWGRFFVITGILSIGVIAGTLASGAGKSRGSLVRGDGSRRDTNSRNDWAKG